MDLPAIQGALAEEGLDGWLLYDFRDLNPIAVDVAGVRERHRTRRWFCLVPRTGMPRWLVHGIERGTFAGVPGNVSTYRTHAELGSGVRDLLRGCGPLAIEYAPDGENPYVSRVDGGTLDLLRAAGAKLCSSGDLVGRVLARWSPAGLAAHRRAATVLTDTVDHAFRRVAEDVRAGRTPTERSLQQEIARRLADEGLTFDGSPIVAVDGHAGDPHFEPTERTAVPIREGSWLLIDIWGKVAAVPDACHADITWVGHVGKAVPPDRRALFDIVRDARDAAIRLVRERASRGEPVRGYELDAAARAVIEAAGYGERFIHRTGHSVDRELHGIGAHLDGYETVDRRRILPGTGFTVEPGIYLDHIGCRSEVCVYWGPDGPEVTTRAQTEVVPILSL